MPAAVVMVTSTFVGDPGRVGTVTLQVFSEGQSVGVGCPLNRASTMPFELKKLRPCTTTTLPGLPDGGVIDEMEGALPTGAVVVVVVVLVLVVVVVLVLEVLVGGAVVLGDVVELGGAVVVVE